MSAELQKAIDSYENYISRNGIDESVVNAYYQAVFWAKEKENGIESALEISERAKEVIEQFVLEKTKADIWMLERYCFDNQKQYDITEKYDDLLKD